MKYPQIILILLVLSFSCYAKEDETNNVSFAGNDKTSSNELRICDSIVLSALEHKCIADSVGNNADIKCSDFLVELYLQARDCYISYYAKYESHEDYNIEYHEYSLRNLEKILLKIIGPINIEGFPEYGQINLETIAPDAGFGMLDGLKYYSKQGSLRVTTQSLLEEYALKHNLPEKLCDLSENEEIYHKALWWNVRHFYYTEIPIYTSNDQECAYAFLGLAAQDWGPFPPKDIYIYVLKDKKIYIKTDSLPENMLPGFSKCTEEWFNSGPENERFKAYRKCYGEKIKGHSIFQTLIIKAQSMVDKM